MKRSIFNRIVAILSVLIMGASSSLAGPVSFFQVVQSVENYRNPAQLRLWDQPYEFGQSATSTPDKSSAQKAKGSKPNGNGALLSEVVVNRNAPQKISVSQGEIEGTLCDCGEILVAAAGFPKWPLFFLAAVPFLFIHGGGENQPPVGPTPTPMPLPTPSPSPPPASVPEPESLFLLFTGLTVAGAMLRRRRFRSKATDLYRDRN